jgi:hypothetical protein
MASSRPNKPQGASVAVQKLPFLNQNHIKNHGVAGVPLCIGNTVHGIAPHLGIC